jgi:uncharacterized protein YbaP (TraB family)
VILGVAGSKPVDRPIFSCGSVLASVYKVQMMKSLLLITPLLALFVGCTTLRRPFLYEFEKDGKVSYLFGTQHRGVPYSQLPDSVIEKFDLADCILVEANMDTEARKKQVKQDAIDTVSLSKGEPKVVTLLTAAQNSKLKEMWPSKYKFSLVDKLSPLGVLAALNENKVVIMDSYTANQWNPLWGIDKNLIERAVSKDKIIMELDTIHVLPDLNACIQTLSLSELRKMLNGENIATSFSVWTAETYRSGDEKQIEREIGENPEMKCLLDERNRAWISKIERAHQTSRMTFVLVGVDHVVVKPSIINMLEKDGFKVRRIAQPTE